ncbi:hypothetical protein [Aeromonas veronii]|uniref:hypothetical protein n=1 Tax=Aeromonas veronii TaxID=654 RepID=UPI0005C1B467|nr:hypothetical protein [Aeromonas veronii]
MSLSRRLIEQMISDVVNYDLQIDTDFNKEKIINLANQAFLIQITQNSDLSIKKSITDKIEHFYFLLKDDGGKENEDN